MINGIIIRKATEYRPSKLRSLFLVGAFSGGFYLSQFIIIGMFAAGLGGSTRLFSMPYRVGFLAFSLLMILYGISTRSFSRIGRLWIPLLLFWLLYFIHMAMDCYFSPIPLRIEPIEYVQRVVGMTYIPMFIFLIYISPKENDLVFKAFWMFNIGCVFFALLYYRNIIGGSYRLLAIQGLDTAMDPITLSYFGVIAALNSFNLIMTGYLHNQKLRFLLLSLVLFGGITILFMGGTRSALICVLIVSIIILFVGKQKPYGRSQPFFILFIIGAIVVSSFELMETVSSDIVSRFEGMSEQILSADPNAGTGRLGIFQEALVQFSQNPLFGSSLELQTRMVYPHNHIIEAFMVTGIVGGSCFVFLCWIALKKCFLIFLKERRYGWIAITFMTFFISGLFSGSITAPVLWYSMLAVYAVPFDSPGASVQSRTRKILSLKC